MADSRYNKASGMMMMPTYNPVFPKKKKNLTSGLTLGLMGLDKTGLECVMGGDNPKLAKAASRIYPF
eukprot:13450832-Ditylum_brightwellii.AAC.1